MCENNKIKKFLKKLSSGRSMVEMIGVMAIVGCLSIGGLAGYVKASHILRTNKLVEEDIKSRAQQSPWKTKLAEESVR